MTHRLSRSLLVAGLFASAVAAQAQLNPPVDIGSQLMITDLRVVEDPIRTNPRNGPQATWTFKYLIENMAGNQNPSDFVLRWLQTWERDQLVNGHVAAARPSIRQLVIDPWLKASGGVRLDLTKAPFKLLAIVNRMDLRVHEGTQVYTGGEGRFVFGVLGPDGKPLPPLAGDAAGGFTVIFEYELVATTTDQLRDWAQRWAGLGRFSVGSPDYLRALEGVTRRFTDRGQAPGKANGNALNQIRSNELALGAPWELREFTLTPTGLRPNPVAVTPDILALNGTPALAQLINDNETALLAGTFLLSESNEGASALAGPFRLSDFPNSSNRTFTAIDLVAPFYDVPWSAAGIRNNDARQAFALNTCGGCHRTETGAAFLQIGFPKGNQLPLRLGQPAALAGFLTGVTVPDPVVPTTSRSFADLKRRQEDFSALLGKLGPTTSSTTVMLPRHMPNFVH